MRVCPQMESGGARGSGFPGDRLEERLFLKTSVLREGQPCQQALFSCGCVPALGPAEGSDYKCDGTAQPSPPREHRSKLHGLGLFRDGIPGGDV